MSKVYTKDPNDVIFDDKYVIFNPTHNELQYESTKANISQLGQLEPILLLDGKCVDGRHRVRIAKELGKMVKCVDLPLDMKEEDIVIRCNTNVMSGRDYDNAQKAIQALRLVNEYGMSVASAAKLMKVDRRMVSYASTIKGFGREDILEILMKGNKIQLDGMVRPSKSLEVICKYVKIEVESSDIVVDDTERIHFNPEALIKTEQGKAWFYDKLDRLRIAEDAIELRMDYMELANLKFKVENV